MILEYEKFKAGYVATVGIEPMDIELNVIEKLKRNAVLVEVIHGSKSLAEDIFMNALEIERYYELKSSRHES